jgi:hypothetical protein
MPTGKIPGAPSPRDDDIKAWFSAECQSFLRLVCWFAPDPEIAGPLRLQHAARNGVVAHSRGGGLGVEPERAYSNDWRSSRALIPTTEATWDAPRRLQERTSGL